MHKKIQSNSIRNSEMSPEELKEEIKKSLLILSKITLSSDYGCQDKSSGFYFRDIAIEAEKVLKEALK